MKNRTYAELAELIEKAANQDPSILDKEVEFVVEEDTDTGEQMVIGLDPEIERLAELSQSEKLDSYQDLLGEEREEVYA